jgi:hypothetical protein
VKLKKYFPFEYLDEGRPPSRRFMDSIGVCENITRGEYRETVFFERRYPDTDMFNRKRVRYPF